ncbi:MAG: hypothetical protein C4327_10685 [Meiothermus sp.]
MPTAELQPGRVAVLGLPLDENSSFLPGAARAPAKIREVLRVIQGLEAPLVGADIVELNPLRDVAEMTAMVAAKFYKELLARMLG